MTRQLLPTNSFNAVAANQRPTLSLPVGELTYHGILLKYGTSAGGGPNRANMEAHINDIRFKINGKVQREHSAAELFLLNETNGIQVADGFLQIFFSEPWRRTVLGEEGLAWGTADIPDLFMEVDLDAAATAPTLEAKVIVSEDPRPLGAIKKIKRHTVPVSAIGVVNYNDLPLIDSYYRLHAVSTDVGNIKVVVDREDEFDLTDAELRRVYADNGLTLPAGLTSAIFDYTQQASDILATQRKRPDNSVRAVSELRVDFDMTAANSFTLITESLGPRD